MKKIAISLSIVCGISACGGSNPAGNPYSRNSDTTTPEEGAGSVTSPDAVYFEADGISMNSVAYDAATDELVLNNMPFDGGDNRYVRTGGFSNGFSRYENASGVINYFAVFIRTENSQVVATHGVLRNDQRVYTDGGYGGAAIERLQGDGALPPTGNYTYLGAYTGTISVVTPTNGGYYGNQYYVLGDVRLEVDTNDLDNVGTIGGGINNRVYYTIDGAPVDVTTLPAVTSIGFVDQPIVGGVNDGSGAATLEDRTEDGPAAVANGEWQAIFTGPNGEELAGVVVLDGTYEESIIRETGAFIATQQ